MKHTDTTSDTGSIQYTNNFILDTFIKKYHSWPTANTSHLFYENIVLGIFKTIIFKVLGPDCNLVYTYRFYIYFQCIFNFKRGVLQLMLFSFCMQSYFCITAWWRPEFRVETSCHLIKLFIKCALVVTENAARYFIINGVAIKKQDCFYYSFPATSMTKRTVGHWPVDFPLPSHKVSFTRIG